MVYSGGGSGFLVFMPSLLYFGIVIYVKGVQSLYGSIVVILMAFDVFPVAVFGGGLKFVVNGGYYVKVVVQEGKLCVSVHGLLY